ncbi:MAG: NAD(P)-dependent oxidoreductase [Candidatus Thorarchaeota archaeon]
MRIFITASFHEDGLRILRKHGTVIHEDWRTSGHVYWGEELLEKLIAVKADAAIVEADAVTQEVFEGLLLKFIGSARDSPKEVDIESATEHGVPIFYAPGRNADSVADLTILLILAQARKLIITDRLLKSANITLHSAEDFTQLYESLKGQELGRSTVGIVGLGQIGSRVAKRLHGFGSHVLFYDPYISAEEGKIVNAEKVELETLMRQSDFVTLHTRATPETFRLIGKEQISWMKPTAHLINTARSAIIDEDALFEAIQTRSIAGAGLDVHSREPVGSDNRFLQFDNVTVTPHIGGNTQDVIYRQSMILAQDIDQFLKGETPKYLANPEVFKKS